MVQAGLVLEGGGMKGIYTAGALDFFLDKGIEFSVCYGVSAGACQLCSYLSKQRKRAYHVLVDYLDNKEYCSLRSLVTTGDLFGADMNYNLVPKYLNPYDYEAFDRYEGKAYAVATDIRTGEPEYFRLRDLRTDMIAVRASSSLPMVSRNVKIGDGLYLDGGISDSIPIRRSLQDGNRRNVIVMTKEIGYRRQPAAKLALIKARYINYPKVYELMKTRHIRYNKTLDYIDAKEVDKEVFVLRPQHKSKVGRVERDREKLDELYREGYEEAAGRYDELMRYLEQ